MSLTTRATKHARDVVDMALLAWIAAEPRYFCECLQVTSDLKDQNLNPKRVYLAIGRLPNGNEVSSYASNPETAQRLLENSGCPKKG